MTRLRLRTPTPNAASGSRLTTGDLKVTQEMVQG